MTEINLSYSLTSEWQHELAKKLGTEVIDDKIIIVPETIGSGFSYFSQIIPGLSIFLLDAIFNIPIIFNRLPSEQDIYIIHFDLSDEVNQIAVNNTKYDVGHTISLGLAVLNGDLSNYFIPVVGKRIFALRLIIDKELLNEYLKKENKYEEFKKIKKNLLFYHHIDSNSKIIIRSIKEKSVLDIEYDSYIKGVSLKILSNFIESLSTTDPYEIYETEKGAIIMTKNYLMDNLDGKFPSIVLLARMAGMSASKYKTLFKNIYDISPNQFFINEKLMLAKKMLTSETFSSQSEVMRALNYSKISYFTTKYFEFFGSKPIDDFIKRPICKSDKTA